MRSIQIVVIAGLLLLALPGVHAQDKGAFTGLVKDKQTGDVLIGANVVLSTDPSFGAATGVDGKFYLSLAPGNYHFHISFTGMRTDTVDVNIVAGATVNRIIEMEPIVNELEGIEIRAGRFDQRIEEITVSMEIIKPEIIEDKNTRNIQTILDYTPGVNILDNEPQIRGGSGFTFGVGSKVAIIVDDMPMLSGDAGRPFWDFIPVENIDQIEVIKGASSVLSGTSALSGAIHIRTKAPGLIPKTKVNVYTGFYSSPPDKSQKWWSDYPYITGVNFLHLRKIKNLDLTFGGMANFDHGYIGAPKPGPYVLDPGPSFTDKQMASQKGRINFNIRKRSEKLQGLDFGLNGNFMYQKAPMVLVWLDDTSGFFRAYPGGANMQNQFIFYTDPYLNYYSKVGFKHSLKARVLYNDSKMTNNQSQKSTTIYADYNFKREYDFLNGFEFIAGLSTQYSIVNAQMYDALGNDVNKLFNMSGYAQIENNFFKILNLSLGARVEYYSMTGADHVMEPIFRAGLSLKILKETYVRMSYGQGYRYPTIAERYIKTTVGSIVIYDNLKLRPEKSWNAEIGLKQGFKFLNYFGYIDIAAFQQEYFNTIEYLFGFWDSTFTRNPGFKFVNTGHSRITGIDISVTGMAKIGPRTSMKTIFGYTYIMPITLDPNYIYDYDYPPGYDKRALTYENTSLDPSNNILKYRFRSTFKGDIEFTVEQFSIGVSAKYFSKIENLDKSIEDFEFVTRRSGGTMQEIRYMDYFYTKNNGNWIVDARISYTFLKIHKIALISNNLLNHIYSLRPLKAEPMRTIMLQYTVDL